ncbi:2 -5 RNA ligase [Chlorella sorokiniana]|uniref:2-5 RNA ligase n=1 Tax=Chlorella sorokiniana TaxID=3076 RepID=A0A2P6TZ80_CHLSO|nr:2 -5 RNA ligase [Chlorella sorokiniana]|eukprot:PRW59353.1 2 -5 RNA ligase [Chlorella sorokiniana]
MAATASTAVAAVLAAAGKTHKTAIALIPPRSVWAPLQEVRCFNDKSFVRWPPHVNLLYPFLDSQHFPAAAQAAAEALRSFKPFQVTLCEPSFFEHGRSCTLWLCPGSPSGELLAVQAALERAFPHCTDLSSDSGRGITAFTPHLSLGQWRTRADVEAAAAQLAAGWSPLSFEVAGVGLIARQGFEDPFRLEWFVPLDGGEPVAVGAPYIATVGDSACSPAPAGEGNAGSNSSGDARWRAFFGIGAEQEDGSVWQFAYGANMCPRKLNGARGLHPLESLPASLPGWRLAFTHRGGMGNLVQLAPGEPGPAGLGAVHGVLHRLSAADYGRLCCMEHEYRPVEVAVQPYGSDAPVPAVAFVSPQERLIADGLPPPQRYLQLLQEGSTHWQLDPVYTAWLGGLQGVDTRGDAYYTGATSGQPLAAWPKIRTGSQPQRGGQQGRRRQGQQRRGRQGQPGGQ